MSDTCRIVIIQKFVLSICLFISLLEGKRDNMVYISCINQ